MIYLNGQKLSSAATLSSKAQAILSMIPLGKDYFNWAVKDAYAPPVSAVNECDLLEMLQQGLNNEPYIRFNSFRTTIRKLFFLNEAEINKLVEIQSMPLNEPADLTAFYKANDIITYAQVNETISQLTAACSARPDLFEMISFEDMQYLVPFMEAQSQSDAAIYERASAFALQTSATIADYMNLVRFYQYLAQHSSTANENPQAESASIEAIYNQLKSSVFEFLYLPNIGALTGVLGFNDPAIMQGIHLAAVRNQFIGYATVSSAALNLVQNLVIGKEFDNSLQNKIREYLTKVKNTIVSLPASNYRWSSDGSVVIVTFSGDHAFVSIHVDNDGSVSLLPETKLS